MKPKKDGNITARYAVGAMQLTERSVVRQAYIWLALPMVLFVAFWFRALVSVPVLLLFGWALWRILLAKPEGLHSEGYDTAGSLRGFCWLAVAIMAYVVVSGIGGLVAQIPNDHAWRNGIFFDLARREWPVTYPATASGETPILCYYFLFWLPSAVVSKITGSILAGDLAQIIYATWGTFIAIAFMASRCRGRSRWAIFAIFVLFNAWDVVTAFFFSITRFSIFHDVWSPQLMWLSTTSNKFANSANPIIYNFIYNQGIPLWVCLTLLLHERHDRGRLLLVFGMLPAYAPIASVAIAPWVGWRLLSSPRQSLTVENVAGFLTALLSALFLLQNDSGARLRPIGDLPQVVFRCMQAILYYGLSLAPFLPFIWRRVRRDTLYWTTIGMAILVAGFEVGNTPDLAWRISLPAILLTAYNVCLVAADYRNMPRIARTLFIAVLAVGSFSSFYDIACIWKSEQDIAAGKRERKFLFMMGKISDEKRNCFYHNFIAEGPSFYRSYLMPRHADPEPDSKPDAVLPNADF